MRKRVAIIGGGISGLAAAHQLREIAPDIDITLLEARSRLGGVIRTTKRNGFLLESAADNFISSSPKTLELCKRLGLLGDLIVTNPSMRQAMVLCRGKLEPIPSGFLLMAPTRLWPFLTTRILSTCGKLRAGLECLVPSRKRVDDESLQSFVCRRFGREMFHRLVQPLVGGIYTADPSRLSVAATMPRFLQMEREHGSLILAMLYQRRTEGQSKTEVSAGARYSQFVTLECGMSSLIDALAKSLPVGAIRLDTPVCCIMPGEHARWSIRVTKGQPTWLDVDGIIVATPANHAARMLVNTDACMAEELSQIEFASCAVVSLAYRREQIRHALNSFGFVVPLAEHRLILSCSFSSLKYPGRAPDGTVLMRVFIGGACQSGLLQLPSDQLVDLAEKELADLLKITGSPILRNIAIQSQAMPQYHVGHGARISFVERRLEKYPTLALAGNSLYGVGVPACIESGVKAAGRVASALKASFPATPQPACGSLV